MNVAHDFFFLTPETVLVTSSDNLDASIGFDGVLGRHPDQASKRAISYHRPTYFFKFSVSIARLSMILSDCAVAAMILHPTSNMANKKDFIL